MATYDDFWNRVVTPALPGMIDFGLGYYNSQQARNEAAQRLRAAQGPVFQQANAATQGLLTQASGNPDELAANRFNAEQALVHPVEEKQLNDLYSMLHARGQLGMGTYNPGIAGYNPNGMLVNPQLAAFYAAQAAARNKAAYDAMNEGQQYANNAAYRASTAQNIASNAQNTGIQADRRIPSQAAANAEMIKGGLGILRDTGLLQKLPGMIGGGIDWLRGLGAGNDDGLDFGGGIYDLMSGAPSPYTSDFSAFAE